MGIGLVYLHALALVLETRLGVELVAAVHLHRGDGTPTHILVRQTP